MHAVHVNNLYRTYLKQVQIVPSVFCDFVWLLSLKMLAYDAPFHLRAADLKARHFGGSVV